MTSKIRLEILTLLKLKKFEQAKARLAQLSSSNNSKTDTDDLIHLNALVLAMQSRLKEAITLLGTITNNTDATTSLCAILCDLGQYEDAKIIAKSATGRSYYQQTCREQLAAALLHTAQICHRAGESNQAANIQRRAKILFPNWTLPKIHLALSEIKLGNFEAAKTELDNIPSSDQENDNYWIIKGISAITLRDSVSAQAYFEKSQKTKKNQEISEVFSRITNSSH